MKKLLVLVLGLTVTAFIGCGDPASAPKKSDKQPAAPASSAAEQTGSSVKIAPSADGKKTENTKTEAAEDKSKADPAEGSKADAPKEDPGVNKKAGVGVTGKGQYGDMSGKPMSIVTVPVSTYFQAQERAVFDMQIPQAMKLYQASNGVYPATQEEFIKNIIKANNIVLPKLPDGAYYYYDAKSAQLMVHSKK